MESHINYIVFYTLSNDNTPVLVDCVGVDNPITTEELRNHMKYMKNNVFVTIMSNIEFIYVFQNNNNNDEGRGV